MLTPLWVTWLVLQFVFSLLSGIGRPWLSGFGDLLGAVWPGAAAVLGAAAVESTLAALLTLTILYAIGWGTSRVLARQAIARFEAVLSRIPLVQVIYGSTKKLLAALQTNPERVKRVVLIDFPAPPLKTVALVTKVVRDSATGRDMAVVYVPTSPNPTSGYMEIVPVELLTPTNWSLDEAMRFVITGGTSAPAEMNFSRDRDSEN
jgi:uncharacterized membrane protein